MVAEEGNAGCTGYNVSVVFSELEDCYELLLAFGPCVDAISNRRPNFKLVEHDVIHRPMISWVPRLWADDQFS